jgi:hypothetical protein
MFQVFCFRVKLDVSNGQAIGGEVWR